MAPNAGKEEGRHPQPPAAAPRFRRRPRRLMGNVVPWGLIRPAAAPCQPMSGGGVSGAAPWAVWDGLEEGATMEDVYLASVETDRGVKEQLRLYDTRGLQEGVELPKHYFSVADGFILVYAITSLEAFQRVEQLKKEIDIFRDKKEVTVIVLGNKMDLLEQRQVETEAAQQWARAEKVRLWEVTVTDRKTLLEPFTFLASKLSQSQNKSTFPLPGRKSKGNNCDN
ncbi:NF-kappa-B inhibitor-interacting Ras-like protein 1 isoform X2 [Coturnix japonica]|uniref:NF-kappa-B inhibitor-interacting Ras-like protein 1 isoform X2 n=1 Tax=Coturnix japonica TaxID=93934 RepID=UPI0013A5E93A|nr:NF-kappa-B inhibitor-interacting Ras-like protein 1 isoform X2 [Coturnix japonica]